MSWKRTCIRRIITFLKSKWDELSGAKKWAIQQVVDGVLWDIIKAVGEGAIWLVEKLKDLLDAASEWLVNKITYIMGA